MRWELVERERVFDGRVFGVERDTLRVSGDGRSRETVFDTVRHPGAAAIVPLHDDGTVSLLHQYRHPVEERIWEIPAGSLREGESFSACAERELEEEVGVRAGRWTELTGVLTTPGFCDEEMRVFLAEGLEPGRERHDDDEDFEIDRVRLDRALEWIESGRIRDAKSVIGLWATRAHLERAGWTPGRGA